MIASVLQYASKLRLRATPLGTGGRTCTDCKTAFDLPAKKVSERLLECLDKSVVSFLALVTELIDGFQRCTRAAIVAATAAAVATQPSGPLSLASLSGGLGSVVGACTHAAGPLLQLL